MTVVGGITGLAAAAEDAVGALLPLMPVTGSDMTGYRVNDRIDPVLAATIEEWTDAAHAVCELHRIVKARA